jgi:hypothetical protein
MGRYVDVSEGENRDPKLEDLILWASRLCTQLTNKCISGSV